MLFGVYGAASEAMTPNRYSKVENRREKRRPKGRPLQILWLCGLLFAPLFPAPSRAQSLDKPSVNIDEDVTAFAFAPDGRIVYSVRRLFKNKKYDMQRDDIWIADSNGGKRRRIFQGEHFTVMKPFTPADSDSSEESEDTGKKGKHGKQAPSERDKPLTPPFTYLVEGFNFSPNGRLVLVGLLSSTLTAESSRAQDERMTLVLDESGREIKLSGDNAVIHNAKDATWLNDGQTIVYLTEAVEPNMLFSFKWQDRRLKDVRLSRRRRFRTAIWRLPLSGTEICPDRHGCSGWTCWRRTTRSWRRWTATKWDCRCRLRANGLRILSTRK